MSLNETLDSLLSKVKDLARTGTVFGDPIEVGETTLLPICKVSVAFGSGTYQSSADAARARDSEAATGAFNMVPLAVVVIHGADSRLLLLDKQDQNMNKLLDLVPNVLDRFAPKKTEG